MADEAAQAPPEPGGGLPLPLILGVGAVVLLAVVYFFFLRSKPAGEEGEAAAAEKKEERAEVIYEDIEALVINAKDPQFNKYLTIKVDLLVANETILEALKEHPLYKTQIQDALIELLSDRTVEELEGPTARDDLKKEVLRRLNALLGPALLKEKETVSEVFVDLYYVNYLLQQ